MLEKNLFRIPSSERPRTKDKRKLPTRGFHKLNEIGNNANGGIRGFTMKKTKNPATKCYFQWG